MEGNKIKGNGLFRRILTAISVMLALAFLLATGASAEENQGRALCLGGFAVGLRFSTDGILVTSVKSVICGGKEVSPASDAGVNAGDIITHINGEKVSTGSELSKTIEKCGSDIKLTVIRERAEQRADRHSGKGGRNRRIQIGSVLKGQYVGNRHGDLLRPRDGLFRVSRPRYMRSRNGSAYAS